MELRPILSAMLRNKTGVLLVGLQIALTLAVVANSVAIIMTRVEKIGRPPGIDSDNLIFVQSYGFGPNYDQRSTIDNDLRLLRSIPGVVSASPISQIPMSGGGSSTNLGPEQTREKVTINTNHFSVDEHGVEALGVKLAEGRNFTQSEIQYNPDPNSSDFVPFVILNKDAARAIFGTEHAVGKTVYDQSHSAIVIGVMENMLGSWIGWDKLTQVMLTPRVEAGPLARYVVRAEPGRRDALMMEIEQKLSNSNPNRAITYVKSHTQIKERSYRADSRMVAFLSVLIGLMVSVTALGIVGLASFHVNVRRKQIGTRRAVGARRLDIIRYFMVENWLLTTGGVVAGSVLAFALGQWLSSAYSLPRLPPMYVVGGVVVLLILGQLAAFLPARRAAAIPPAIATRTV
ncbi:MAG TPA: FtsX-like permease family protein [Steroidobacteraceae bacterium]|jgi:ABC-type transport system, involved in lipoprotein release, permease component|nr:FtsX-like permease family protein [Steroidobacteraceae bacterium]